MPAPDDRKREREWDAFRSVYKESDFESVIPSEQPDFIVAIRPGVVRGSDNLRFGVEVTDLFLSQADARTHCLPDYVPTLLKGGRPRHKDDYSELKVTTATLYFSDATREPVSIPVISRPQPTLQQYKKLLVDAINTKAAKFEGYDKSLSHINLILRDHLNLLSSSAREDFSQLVLDEQVRNAVAGSRFREIFLITFLAATEVYIPLVMLSLVCEYYLFGTAFSRVGETEFEEDETNVSILFTHFLRARGYPALLGGQGGTKVLLGSTGLVIDETAGITLFQYADLPLLAFSEPPSLSGPAKSLLETTICMYDQVKQEVSFMVSLAQEVRPRDLAVGSSPASQPDNS